MCTVSLKEKLKHGVRIFLCRKHKQQEEEQQLKRSIQEIKKQRANHILIIN